MMCDIGDRTLDPDHALRDSESAERGIRDGIGLASIRLDADMLQEIRVVAVKDSTVGHGCRQIQAHPATQLLDEFDPRDTPAVVKTDVIIDLEFMALAGDPHVIVAIEANLCRPA